VARLRARFAVLTVALLLPVGLLIQRALSSAEFERRTRHEIVAERVLDEMERELSRLVEREEARPFGHYQFYFRPEGKVAGTVPVAQSPLARTPGPGFVVGHFQIDPDGSWSTPLQPPDAEAASRSGDWKPSPEVSQVVNEIERAVGGFWRSNRVEAPAESDRFELSLQRPGSTLAQDREPSASLSKDDASGSAYDMLRSLNQGVRQRAARKSKVSEEYAPQLLDELVSELEEAAAPEAEPGADVDEAIGRSEQFRDARARVELGTLTGRVLDARHLMLYRTVLVDGGGYRQGLLLDVEKLAEHLRSHALSGELADHVTVDFTSPYLAAPAGDASGAFVFVHRFAEPFDGLGARLVIAPLPGVGGATYIYLLSALLVIAGGLGLVALYRMVSVVVRFAERRSNFAAAVSHELKTPLTAIRMYGEMLRDGLVPSDAKRDEYYRHITSESERLSRLINNVLEFSKLERGKRAPHLVTDSLGPVVAEVAEFVRPHTEQEGFDLDVEIQPDLPPVCFDRDALMQVIFNLVDNALKYAHDAEPRRIVLRCAADEDGEVRISLRDHGPGIAAQHLKRIFEPFYRGESELTRRTKGTGLGLALVRSLVEQMGARVTGRNAPHGGFEVHISFAPARG
jgi:signal transduction histidine kinase